jgi:hypothetical protein
MLFSPTVLRVCGAVLLLTALGCPPTVRADQPPGASASLPLNGPSLADNSSAPAAAPVTVPAPSPVLADAPAVPTPVAVAGSTDITTPGASAIASAGPLPGSDPSQDIASAAIPPLTGAAPKVTAPPPVSAPSTPSTNATINLIHLMVKRNLISQDDADGLIREAQQEADSAAAQAAATAATAQRALVVQQSAPAPAPAASTSSTTDDEMRISYVPDVVRKQITDQVTQNVMEETREEHLAQILTDNQIPEWIKRVHLSGDVRVRYEPDMFPSGNLIGNFVNFNSINTGSAINVSNAAPTAPQIPQFNVNQDRTRFRLRGRIGAGFDLGENFTAGLRIATGADDNPTSENQTFGLANNAQGGDFSKYNVWLDRAFVRYEYAGASEDDSVALTVGRFDNPFLHTSMVYADDLAFDGAVLKGSYTVDKGVTPFATLGAFPLFNTDFNYANNNADKFTSEDKYLFAVQSGVKWQISKDVNFTGAGGYYDFENVQGKVSDPIFTQDSAGDSVGNTDDSRPSFAQNGNTYIALRNYVGTAATGSYTQQYYGLASQFRVISLYGKLAYTHFDPFDLSVTGEFIENVAFDRNSIVNGGPVNNPGPKNNLYTPGLASSFFGNNNGYMVHFDAGKVALESLWDWNIRLSYRYVQSDATLDAFTDSDFGAPLYGTNLKGFTIGGQLALSKRVWLGLRYMSADNVAGPTFHSDVVQFDINAKF